MAQVLLDRVSKVYPGNVKAVDAISLHIPDTKFIVFVGPSGCGKSTTLRMIAGLEEITDGAIHIGDRVVNDVAPKDRDIAMVFQNYALYPHMTVYKNMAFGLKLRGMPKKEIDQRVREAAQILGITHLLDRRPKALSGGQRQRVAVGRAIVRHPAVFLFDEPLSNLDAKLRVETRAELKRLHQRLQTTTIYVTHDQEEAMTLGDKVVVMSDGLIQQADSPLVVYQRPRNRFVAGFLGTPPMNFLDGALVSRDGRLYFVGGGIELRLTAEQTDTLDGRAPREVVLGLRPEALSLAPLEHADGVARSITTRLDVAETLGSQMDLFVMTPGEQRLVARVDAHPMKPGSNVTLYVDPVKTHVFETGPYGRNLTLGEADSISVEQQPALSA